MQLEVILAGNRVATKPPQSKRVKPGIKKKPRWRLENGVLVQTPKYLNITVVTRTLSPWIDSQWNRNVLRQQQELVGQSVGLELKVGSLE